MIVPGAPSRGTGRGDGVGADAVHGTQKRTGERQSISGSLARRGAVNRQRPRFRIPATEVRADVERTAPRWAGRRRGAGLLSSSSCGCEKDAGEEQDED